MSLLEISAALAFSLRERCWEPFLLTERPFSSYWLYRAADGKDFRVSRSLRTGSLIYYRLRLHRFRHRSSRLARFIASSLPIREIRAGSSRARFISKKAFFLSRKVLCEMFPVLNKTLRRSFIVSSFYPRDAKSSRRYPTKAFPLLRTRA